MGCDNASRLWTRREFEQASVLGEERCNDPVHTHPMSTRRSTHKTQDILDLIALRREMVLPVGEHTGGGKDESHVQLCILDTDAFVRATAKHEIIFRIGVGRAIGIEPPFGDQAIMVGVHFRVVQGVVKGRDHHTAGRDRVIGGDREWLCGFVRNLATKMSSTCHRNVVDGITMVTGGLKRMLSFTKALR